jgi:glucuronoarabinoxylan endo-1,4-beta-xylanase
MKIPLFLTFYLLSCLTVNAADITVDGNVTHQKIDGFGGMAGAIINIKNMSAIPQKEVLDLLFDKTNGMGLSIIRTAISHNYEKTPDNYDITVQANDAWFLDQAKSYGCTTFIASPWSPPAWMKTNNDVNNGGIVWDTCYDDYAEYLSQWLKDFKSEYDHDFYTISVQNEPDANVTWNSCDWSGSQLHTFMRDYLIPEWKAVGHSAKIMLTEQLRWTESYGLPTLNDTLTEPYLGIFAAHGYGASVPAILPTAMQKNKPIWQTEENGDIGGGAPQNDPSINDGLFWAERIHKWLTVAQLNAWVWHWVVTDKSWAKPWKAKIIETDGDNYICARRLWTIGNFTRFIRPGYYRIECTAEPDSGVHTSAYKDTASGKFLIVAVNSNSDVRTLNVTLNNISTGTVTPYTTTDSLDLEASTDITVTGNAFSASLPAKSVTTFTNISTVGIKEKTGSSYYNNEHLYVNCSPNPFKYYTRITVKNLQSVTGSVLGIYDIKGVLLKKFNIDRKGLNVGIIWDGRDNSGKKMRSGCYFVEFHNRKTCSKSMLFLVR